MSGRFSAIFSRLCLGFRESRTSWSGGNDSSCYSRVIVLLRYCGLPGSRLCMNGFLFTDGLDSLFCKFTDFFISILRVEVRILQKVR
eukprot:snap_masked-scaffold_13-processed-gene-5.36-mRNA-1 protein AED:1.00 eAED:1.00 QI:0/0/0/0/1/1/3/0/86